jgi:hypothetical protein
MDDSEIPMDKLAKIYQKIRTHLQALTTEYETQVENAQVSAARGCQRDEEPHAKAWYG